MIRLSNITVQIRNKIVFPLSCFTLCISNILLLFLFFVSQNVGCRTFMNWCMEMKRLKLLNCFTICLALNACLTDFLVPVYAIVQENGPLR
jgi:hypothetical protein